MTSVWVIVLCAGLILFVGWAVQLNNTVHHADRVSTLASLHPSWSSELIRAVDRGDVREGVAERHPGWSLLVLEAVTAHELLLGMTPEMVVESWGRPADINRTVSVYGILEQWVYERWHATGFLTGFSFPDRYAYLQDGMLTSWQE